jgi:hypothetical protein
MAEIYVDLCPGINKEEKLHDEKKKKRKKKGPNNKIKH